MGITVRGNTGVKIAGMKRARRYISILEDHSIALRRGGGFWLITVDLGRPYQLSKRGVLCRLTNSKRLQNPPMLPPLS